MVKTLTSKTCAPVAKKVKGSCTTGSRMLVHRDGDWIYNLFPFQAGKAAHRHAKDADSSLLLQQ